MIEVVFWGGPKDGHIQYQTNIPSSEVYCLDDASPLIDLFDLYALRKEDEVKHKVYSIYKMKRLSRGRYKYVYIGLI